MSYKASKSILRTALNLFIWCLRKAFAYTALMHMYVAYFSMDTWIGFIVYAMAFVLGFMGLGDTMTPLEVACVSYVFYVYGVITQVFLMFKVPRIRDLCYKELGEERVRRLIGRSTPGATFLLRATSSTSLISLIGLAGHSADHHLKAGQADAELTRRITYNDETFFAQQAVLAERRNEALRTLTESHHKAIYAQYAKDLAAASAHHANEAKAAHQIRQAAQNYQTLPERVVISAKQTEVAKAAGNGISNIATGIASIWSTDSRDSNSKGNQ